MRIHVGPGEVADLRAGLAQNWPPRLASSPSDCEVHCITVDSLVEHSDQVAGVEAPRPLSERLAQMGREQ